MPPEFTRPERSISGTAARGPFASVGGAAMAALGAALLLAQPTPAAAADAAVAAQLEALAQRLQQLEQRNAALEQEVASLRRRQATASAAPALTPSQAAGAAPAASPEARIAHLEQRVADLGRVNELLEVPEEAGPSVEVGLVAVAQRVSSNGAEDGTSESRGNYRGDVEVSVPLSSLRGLGGARLSAFGHLRFGQGTGLALRPTHTATRSIPCHSRPVPVRRRLTPSSPRLMLSSNGRCPAAPSTICRWIATS